MLCSKQGHTTYGRLRGHAAFSQAGLADSNYLQGCEMLLRDGQAMYTLEFLGFFSTWMVLLCPVSSLA